MSNQLLLSNLNRSRIKTQKHKKLQFPRSALVISCFVVDKMVVVVGIEKGGVSIFLSSSSLRRCKEIDNRRKKKKKGRFVRKKEGKAREQFLYS